MHSDRERVEAAIERLQKTYDDFVDGEVDDSGPLHMAACRSLPLLLAIARALVKRQEQHNVGCRWMATGRLHDCDCGKADADAALESLAASAEERTC